MIDKMKKINSNHKRKLSEWRRIFDSWSDKMNDLYPDKSKRNDAAEWDDNPTNWMNPFSDNIYNAWCEYDNGMFHISLLGDKVED